MHFEIWEQELAQESIWRTPLFIQESQSDNIFVHSQPDAIDFALAVKDSLDPVEAAFSPRTSTHVLSSYKAFTKLKVDGYSLADLLGNWFFSRAGHHRRSTDFR